MGFALELFDESLQSSAFIKTSAVEHARSRWGSVALTTGIESQVHSATSATYNWRGGFTPIWASLGINESCTSTKSFSSSHTYLGCTVGLGSVALTTDSEGKVLERFDYDPFGAVLGGASGRNKHTFTGKESEDNIGLYYFNARWMDASVGRFAQVDPVVGDAQNSQDWNQYAYVRNDPINNLDPTGKSIWSDAMYLLDAGMDSAKDMMTGGGGLVDEPTVAPEIGAVVEEEITSADPSSALDKAQLALDALGFVPGVGDVADAGNVVADLARGNYGDAGLGLLSAVPLLGTPANAAKIAKRAKKVEDKFSKGSKALEQLEGIEKAQAKFRKNGQGSMIQNAKKSAQALDNRLKSSKDGRDLIEEFED